MAKLNGLYTGLGVALLGVLLAGAAFVLVPKDNELGAMRQRALVERAWTLYAKGDVDDSIDLLQPIVEKGGAGTQVAHALLHLYEVSGRTGDFTRLEQGPSGRGLGDDDLHAARVFYQRNNMPAATLEVVKRLLARHQADTDELVLWARSEAQSGDARESLSIARSLATHLRNGAHPAAAAFVMESLSAAGARAEATAFVSRWSTRAVPIAALNAAAQILTSEGYPELAVTLLHDRSSESYESRAIFVNAMRIASERSPQIRGEFTRDVLAALPAMPDGPAFDLSLHDLFEFGDLDMVIAELGRTGSWRMPRIRQAFDYSLRKAGRQDALRGLLIQDAGRQDASFDETRRIAGELAEIGFVADGETILKKIAAGQGPRDGAVNDLFYLWGAHHRPADVAWLAQRARGARGADVEGWIAATAKSVSSQAALDTIALVQRDPGRADPSALAMLRVRYLGWQGDLPAIRRALGDVAGLKLTPAQFAELANWGCQAGDASITEKMAAQADDSDLGRKARQCATRFRLDAARQALAHGDLAAALAGYRSAAAEGGAMTAQDYFDYASATDRSPDPSGSGALFSAALERLPVSAGEGVRTAMLRAAILTKIHREDAAREVLQGVLSAHPGNSRARLMLAELYMTQGAYSDALKISRQP